MSNFTSAERDEVAQALAAIAREAGKLLAQLHDKSLKTERKSDGSPVSEADRAAEAIVEAGLAKAFPDIAIVSEENAESQRRKTPERFFLVDPLDGTRAFLRGGPDFCVLIALIEHGAPIAAALDAPLRGKAYRAGATAWGGSTAEGDRGTQIHASPSFARETAIISVHHAGEASRKVCGSLGVKTILTENSALKFARLAEGEADVYPRAGTTMQWDVAAGHALLGALGGGVLDLDGNPLRYGSDTGSWEVPGFIAYRRLG
jgi:3'(2'),5'-bisphosphate nucleotidase